jgi:hypothetical protein
MLRLEDLHRDNIVALYDWRATHPPYGPCSASHPHIASCALTPLDRFFSVFRWTLPIYGALHVVPMLLFKRKAVVRSPAPMILRAGWGTMRSAAFLGVFVAIYQGMVEFVTLHLRPQRAHVVVADAWAGGKLPSV